MSSNKRIMVIDIQKKVIQLRLQKLVITILLVLSIIFFGLTGVVKNTFLGLDKYAYLVIFAAVYILYIVYQMMAELNYIYFNDSGNKIIIRYFSTSILNTRKHSIEIPKEMFYGFKIEKKLLGVKQILTLFQKNGKNIAQYPPISISLLNKYQRGDMNKTLLNYGKAV